MKYIMVTAWHDHWDKLPGGLTLYTTSMLVAPMGTQFLKDGTPTTFLLFSRNPRRPHKAWSGKVVQVDHDQGSQRIAFRVKLSREIRFPRRYAKLDDGWYVEQPVTIAESSGFW